MTDVPVVDVTPLRVVDPDPAAVSACATAIDDASRTVGFFCVTGHGIASDRRAELDRLARAFFALATSEKARIAMVHGGRAWRGWFAEGDELTAGRPDHKEGVYFGTELPPEDPRVADGVPLHGANLFPEWPAELRGAVLEWIAAVTALGQDLLRGMAIGLGLPPNWFARHLTADPTVLFRIFRYPVVDDPDGWGVAEHTDYGLITLLAHDGTPGLEVRPRGTDAWVDVPVVPDSFVVNLGDMLEAMTAGRYRSTPHRVRVPEASEAPPDGRLSFPLFLDPGFGVPVAPIPLGDAGPHDDAPTRWDGLDLSRVTGTYGDYLTAKVARVFPDHAGLAGIAGRSAAPD